MLTYKKKGGGRIQKSSSKKKPKKVRTSKYVPRLKQNIIKLPTTNSRSKKQQKDLNRQRVERLLGKWSRPRKIPKSLPPLPPPPPLPLPPLPPPPLPPPPLPTLLPIFTEPTTSTLSHCVGRWIPKTTLDDEEIRELPINREDDQITYLVVSHGNRPELDKDGKIVLVQNNYAFKGMRFGVTANDGGSCYIHSNSVEVLRTDARTLGYGTQEGDSVTTFERRFPFISEDKLSFPNFRISEGYAKGGYFFPSGIWRVYKGKIELFGITEVIENGFFNGIDLTKENVAMTNLEINHFLARFRNGTASRKMFTFQQFIDQMTRDPYFQQAEVVNVLFQMCSGVGTETADGQELSRAWRGESEGYPPYRI